MKTVNKTHSDAHRSGMKIHPLTLEFIDGSGYLESAYQAFHHKRFLYVQRAAILIAVFFYAFFGLLDAYLIPEKKQLFWFIRYAVVCPFALGVFVFSFFKAYQRYRNAALFLMFITAGFGVDMMILLAEPPASYSYYTGILLILIYLFTFIRIGFVWAFTASWLMIAFYEIIAVGLIPTPNAVLVNNNFFIISGNIFCILAGYSIERASRKSFYLASLLDREKRNVVEKNLALETSLKNQYEAEKALKKKNAQVEQIVQERTRQLQESETLFKAAIDYSPIGMIVSRGPEEKVMAMNKKFTELFGYTIEDLPNVSAWWPMAYPQESYRSLVGDMWKRSLDQYREGKTDVVRLEVLITCKDGAQKEVSVHAASVGDINFVAFFDLTDFKVSERERKELEGRLRQVQKMESIGTIAGGVAHDFNNILGIIIGNAELAVNDIPVSNRAHARIETIKETGLRAAGIVKQLLNFSRKAEKELGPVSPAGILRESLDLLRSTIPATIEIQQVLKIEDDVTIMADPVQINRVLMNLFSNAAQAMENESGIIKVTAEKITLTDLGKRAYPELNSGDYLKLSVADSGTGIPDELKIRVFDPYFTTKEIGKGSGLGLSVVMGIIKSHNGYIEVGESTPGGTVFNILLPIIGSGSPDREKPEREIIKGSEQILFVDDEELITSLSKEVLQEIGYAVTTQIDPVRALDLIKQKPDGFDLVITDMTMPGMNGIQFFDNIKAVRPDLPVIVCTGFSNLIDTDKARQLGIAALVMKPIRRNEIAGVIRDVLDHK